MQRLNTILEYILLAVCLLLAIKGTMQAIPFAILYVGARHEKAL